MEQKHRSEFPEKELWDLTALYQDREDFLRAIEKAREDINQFSRDYKGNLHTLLHMRIDLMAQSYSATLQ